MLRLPASDKNRCLSGILQTSGPQCERVCGWQTSGSATNPHRRYHSRGVIVCVAVAFSTACIARLEGQANPPPSAPEPATKHIFGVFPNYNTSPSLSPYVPITSKEKFKIASEDALDPGGIVVAAAAGGVAQLLNSNPFFGQEVSGYGRYFAAAYGNHVIGDFMTEGVYPSLLHQDPRYF